MNESVKTIDWFRILSPAVLGVLFSAVAIIISYARMEGSGGWSYLGVIIFVPVFAILFALDFIIKLLLKDKTLIIWLVELLALGLIYFIWVSRFVG